MERAPCSSRPATRKLSRRLCGGRRVCRRIHRALDPTPPCLPHRPLRPREHGPGGLDNGAWRLPAHDRPAGPRYLPAGGALRPDPGRLRAPVVDLAEPGPAADGAGDPGRARGDPGLLARPQAPGLRTRGARLLPRLPALSACAMADPGRVPPGRARLSVAPVRVLVPGRGPVAPQRAVRDRGRGGQSGHPSRDRPAATLARNLSPAVAGRMSDLAVGAL